MTAYYNEIDPYAAEWLRNLIKAGYIADGEVDTRSIVDVQPGDLAGFTQCHFFAGIGVWSYALRLAEWPDDQPIWTGSCPCQPFSAAGKRKGVEDERHLWPVFHRLISECRPSVVMGEQVAGRGGLAWLDGASDDLESDGYSVGALCLRADALGAPHVRKRIYWASYSKRDEQSRQEPRRRPAGRMGRVVKPVSWDEPWAGALRRLRALDDGSSYGVASTDAARNALVAPLAATFIRAVMEART